MTTILLSARIDALEGRVLILADKMNSKVLNMNSTVLELQENVNSIGNSD